MKNYFVIGLAVVLVFGATAASAQRTARTGSNLRALPGSPEAGATEDGTPDAMVSIDLAGVESWDAFGSPNNEIINQILGSGAIMTGIGWNLTIATVGGSWLSDADATFGSSSLPSITLTPGLGDDASGTASYSSGGIVDFTDIPLPNIVLDADGVLRIEFSEFFDDVLNAVDANYTSGTFDVPFIAGAPVPTMPGVGLLVLLVVLLAAGTLLLRRRASQS